MELSNHGVERIQERTKMVQKDVLDVVNGGAAIELGTIAQGAFLLFYSPYDRNTKIAVVSQDRKVLVSIWENYFKLPEGIKRPSGKDHRKARIKLQDFLYQRMFPSSVKRSNADYEVHIEIRSGKTVLHRHVLKYTFSKEPKDIQLLFPVLTKEMRALIAEHELEERDILPSDMYHFLVFQKGDTTLIRKFMMRSKNILKRFKVA